MAFYSRSLQSGSSSTSSYLSSSLGRAPSAPSQTNYTDTPSSSAVSAVTFLEPSLPPTTLRPLDLGPPGYQATITLFERTANELTVYLGPWELIESDTRSVRWQCSYQGETLEQFLPMSLSSQVYPVTLHGQHRPYSDPSEMELFVTFREPHRIRYTSADGKIVHDAAIEVKYEFTSPESSTRFQGDLRRQDLAEYFDIDVVFSDAHARIDHLTGAVRGLATIQRIKLWRDRTAPHQHSLTFFSNRPATRRERRYREYLVTDFHEAPRSHDDKHRECRLRAVGRQGSAPNANAAVRARSFSLSSWGRSSSGGSDTGGSSPGSSVLSVAPLDIRWLGIRFSRDTDYRRFLQRWITWHREDSEFRGGSGGVDMPFPPYTSSPIDLPSPAIRAGGEEQVRLDLDRGIPRSVPSALQEEPLQDWPIP